MPKLLKTDGGQLSSLLSASDAVIGAALLTILFAVAGVWLDSKLHTAPWLALLATFAGMILGMIRMVKKASTGMKLSDKSATGKLPEPLPYDQQED